MRRAAALWLLAGLGAAPANAAAPVGGPLPGGEPVATVDLATPDGVALVQGQWRYADVRLVERTHRAPGADGQPTGAPVRTLDYEPHAGVAGFDDSQWPRVAPAQLAERRGSGRLCFGWYRIALTLPERVGEVETRGTTAVFQTTLDDYAEVWVDGELPRAVGQRGGSVVAGWNAPNRVVVARGVEPGRRIELAIFAANGPLSDPPANFIWMREARLELFRDGAPAPYAVQPAEVNFSVERFDPGLDAVLPPNPKLIALAEGFAFTEGPVWLREAGALLFSDPNRNTIYRYEPAAGALAVFRDKSGYDGADIGEYRQPGSNGLAVDREGRLTIDQHGERRVVRVERDGALTVLADRFDGRRLNSPNDLVYRSDGALFFTDPPFGLPRFADDPRKELPFSGVYVLRDGVLRLASRSLAGPNGIAFSPDERTLYVGNWDERRKVVVAYDAAPDGALANERVFADLTGEPGEDAIDGIEVDRAGHLYVSGPGGLWIFAPDGRRLGLVRTPRHPHNFAFGGADGRTLYLTARSGLYAMRLEVPGAGF
jgi:gluconolactonase